MDFEAIPRTIRTLINKSPGSPVTKELLQRSLKVGVPEDKRGDSAALLGWTMEQDKPARWVGVNMQIKAARGGGTALEDFLCDGIEVDVGTECVRFSGIVRVPVTYTQTLYNTAYISASTYLDLDELEGLTVDRLEARVSDALVDAALEEDPGEYIDYEDGEPSDYGYGEIEADTASCELDELEFSLSELEDLIEAVEQHLNPEEEEDEDD